MAGLIYWLDLAGTGVFAVSGALVASRKQLDLVGFGLLATVTGVGGGTLRDLLLDRPVAWLQAPEYVLLCVALATTLFFLAPHIERRYPVLLWADAAGLALFAVLGARIAQIDGTGFAVAVVMGVMSATFGGMIRDVIGNEIPLILRKEIYATAAALAALVFLLAQGLGVAPVLAQATGFAAGLGLRAAGIRYRWSLPSYRPRPGRAYPDG